MPRSYRGREVTLYSPARHLGPLRRGIQCLFPGGSPHERLETPSPTPSSHSHRVPIVTMAAVVACAALAAAPLVSAVPMASARWPSNRPAKRIPAGSSSSTPPPRRPQFSVPSRLEPCPTWSASRPTAATPSWPTRVSRTTPTRSTPRVPWASSHCPARWPHRRSLPLRRLIFTPTKPMAAGRCTRTCASSARRSIRRSRSRPTSNPNM